MKSKVILTLLMGLGLFAGANAEEYWSCDFKNGKFPSDVTVDAYSGPAAISSCYKNINLNSAWTVAAYGDRYAAFSPSHSRDTKQQVKNRFYSPYFTVGSSDTFLTFEAIHVLPGKGELGRIFVQEEGKQEQCVTYFFGKEGYWHKNFYALKDYNGKKIRLIFECCSTNCFLLGVSNIYVGTLDYVPITGTLTGPASAANGKEVVLFRSTVSEVYTGVKNLRIIRGPEGFEHQSMLSNSGGPFTVTPPENSTSTYSLWAKYEGEEILLAEHTITTDTFERTVFVDEGTGMWCNSCPTGILEINEAEKKYGNNLAVVCTHINDLFEQRVYWPNLGFYSIPRFKINRGSSSTENLGDLSSYFTAHTKAGIETEMITLDNTGTELTWNGTATFDFDYNNQNGRYALGYIITGDYHRSEFDKEFYQENNLTLPKYKEYYFLPSKIPADLAYFNHVNMNCDFGFEDYPESNLQSNFTSMEPINLTIKMVVPPFYMSEWRNFRLIVFVKDTQTGEILNCTQTYLNDDTITGVGSLHNRAESKAMRLVYGHNVEVTLEEGESGIVEEYDFSGQKLRSHSVSEGTSILNSDKGGRIFLMRTNLRTETLKSI